MADPRIVPAQDRRAPALSPLMVAHSRNGVGEKVNFCPFGCPGDDLDEFGYCRHLVGFTNEPREGGVLEPMHQRGGRRYVDSSALEKVRKGDRFVQITVSYRVYREAPDLAPAKALTQKG